jgi:hypothetical protein
MSKDNDGGPAFPVADFKGLDGFSYPTGAPGMTLRDYFAAQALAGMNASLISSSEFPIDPLVLVTMAESAYAQADAMLEAQKK